MYTADTRALPLGFPRGCPALRVAINITGSLVLRIGLIMYLGITKRTARIAVPCYILGRACLQHLYVPKLAVLDYNRNCASA
jgi:hypothetical protein